MDAVTDANFPTSTDPTHEPSARYTLEDIIGSCIPEEVYPPEAQIYQILLPSRCPDSPSVGKIETSEKA